MTNKHVAKLLQGKSFNKELFLDSTNKASIIEQIQSVAHLPLENIRLGATATSIIPDIAAALENLNPHLKKLTLAGDCIGSVSACVVARLVQNSSLLKLKITFADTWLCDWHALLTIINSIEQSSVRRLKLHGLHIVDPVTESIIGLITSSEITELCLNNCTFKNTGILEIINAVSGSNLRTFRLCESSFNNEKIVALTTCIENSSLIKLCLRGNCGGLSRDTMQALMEAIQKSNIEHLNLRGNNIIGANINTCIEGSCVKKLKFARCSISNTDLIIIIDGIKRSCAFESLTINDMKLDDPCIGAICHLLENSCIKTIKLNDCNLRDTQLMALIPSIKQSSLRSLGLKNNHIGLEGAQAMCKLLENYNLIKLNLDSNLPSRRDSFNSLISSAKQKSVLEKLNLNTYHRSRDLSADHVIDFSRMIFHDSCQSMNKKIRTKIKKMLQAQQQSSHGHYKVKSANNI